MRATRQGPTVHNCHVPGSGSLKIVYLNWPGRNARPFTFACKPLWHWPAALPQGAPRAACRLGGAAYLVTN